MNIAEIQQAIDNLPPEELARFRAWFKEYKSDVKTGDLTASNQIRETLRRPRGSLKGKGGLKTLMEARRKETRT